METQETTHMQLKGFYLWLESFPGGREWIICEGCQFSLWDPMLFSSWLTHHIPPPTHTLPQHKPARSSPLARKWPCILWLSVFPRLDSWVTAFQMEQIQSQVKGDPEGKSRKLSPNSCSLKAFNLSWSLSCLCFLEHKHINWKLSFKRPPSYTGGNPISGDTHTHIPCYRQVPKSTVRQWWWGWWRRRQQKGQGLT